MDTPAQPAPTVRARATQELLAAMDGFEPGLEERVRVVAPPAALAAVDEAAPTGWSPTSVTRHVIDGVFEVLGAERAPRLWRHFVVHNFVRSPLLRFFIDAVLRVVGVKPRAFMAKTVKAWTVTYRDCGTLELMPGDEPRELVLRLRDVPGEMFAYPQYFRALGGAFEGFLDLVHVDATCTCTVDGDAREVRWHLHW